MSRASDCWLLDTLHSLFSTLARDGELDTVADALLGSSLSPYLVASSTPFYAMGKEAFLLHIERVRLAEVDSSTASTGRDST